MMSICNYFLRVVSYRYQRRRLIEKHRNGRNVENAYLELVFRDFLERANNGLRHKDINRAHLLPAAMRKK